MSLADELKRAGLKIQKSNINHSNQPTQPLWRGPERDGITQGLLQRFLACRERFRILTTQGLKSRDTFNHRSGYGNMFHLCEESYAKAQPERGWTWERAVSSSLTEYCRCLCERYPTQQELIDHWYRVCKIQFPLYIEYWNNHSEGESKSIIPILQEYVFAVHYTLPSGRVVILRGKFDGVVKINDELWLCEMKTKGDIREGQLKRQLRFDLQTLFYLVVLKYCRDSRLPYLPYAGVRYNVIRRPLSGGKGTIVRHKPSKKNPLGESKEDFYNRLAEYIKEEPEHYFMRWNVSLLPTDVEKFRRECLDPILEQLCDWWAWINSSSDPFRHGTVNGIWGIHWRHPFGCYNSLDEGGTTELDDYLETGDDSGLEKVKTLFPELEGIV